MQGERDEEGGYIQGQSPFLYGLEPERSKQREKETNSIRAKKSKRQERGSNILYDKGHDSRSKGLSLEHLHDGRLECTE